jgi:hypothetical protein
MIIHNFHYQIIHCKILSFHIIVDLNFFHFIIIITFYGIILHMTQPLEINHMN